MNLRAQLADFIDPARRRARRPFPTVARATLAEVAASRLNVDSGLGSWAPTAYGHYYAQSVPVYSAIKIRALAAAEAPIQVMRRGADGDQPVETSDPLQTLMDKVNPFWTRADLIVATQVYRLLWGSAFWFVEKRGRTPLGIWPLRPDRMRIIAGRNVRPGGDNYIIGYEYRGDSGRAVTLLPEEVIHFREFNPLDEFAGLSPIAPARQQFDAGKDAVLYNRLFFSSGGHPDMLFLTNDVVTDETREEFLRAFDKRYKGVEKAHSAMLWSTTVGPKPERLGLTQTEMQFLDGLRWTVEDGSRVFEVPREMLGVGDVTFANRELAERHFYRAVVSRDWQFMADEINEMLLPVLGASPDVYVRFDSSKVRAIHDAQLEREAGLLTQLDKGAITINEFREERGLDPVSWGDRPWLPVTLVQVGDGSEAEPEDQDASFAAYGEAHVKGLKQRETRFETAQRGLFGDQESSVLAAVDREEAKQIGVFVAKQVPPFERIFDPTEWIRVFTRRGRPLVAAAITQAAREGANTFKLPPFDPDNPQVVRWLDERVDFWATRVNEETGRLLRSEIEDAAKNGEGIFEVRERVRKIFAFSREFRAERVARTEMLAASSRGHVEVYRQSGVVEGKRWVTTVDDRTRATHLAANGQVVGLDDKFQVGGSLMEAPGLGDDPAEVVNCRCFPGDTLVRSVGLIAAYRRWYEGDLVEVTTARGDKLAGTPNHPVLTRHGWRALSLIREGDDLVRGPLREGMVRGEPNIDHMPAAIGQVFDSLALSHPVQRMRTSVVDFHGDGRQGQVDVVLAGRPLPDGFESPRPQQVEALRLSASHAQMRLAGDEPTLNGISKPQPISLACGASGYAHGPQSSGDSVPIDIERLRQSELRLARKITSHNGLSIDWRVGPVPETDLLPDQGVSNRPVAKQPASPDFLRQSAISNVITVGDNLDALPRDVVFDRVLDIRIRRFAGHVYNLETVSGWYDVNGIVAHNCATVPVVRRSRRALPAPRAEVGETA